MRTKRIARDVAYRLAVLSGWPARRRRGAGATVFAFHDIAGDATGRAQCDISLHVPARAFDGYLEWIVDTYAVVPLAEIVERRAAHRSLDGLAAITFDDAYRGVFRHGLPALRARGLPSTVFVVPEAAERPRHFWWDLLAVGGDVPPEVRARALGELRGDRDEILAAFPAATDALPDEMLPATWAEIERAVAGHDDVALESHGLTHRNLASLAADEAREELLRSRDAIAARTGQMPTLVAYPYGGMSAETRRQARDAGYAAGFSVVYGSIGDGGDALALPRVNVPADINIDALACWAAGIGVSGR